MAENLPPIRTYYAVHRRWFIFWDSSKNGFFAENNEEALGPFTTLGDTFTAVDQKVAGLR